MAKKDTKTRIRFNYDETTYTLEFTAASIKKMEQQGFKFGKMDEIALTAPEELFCGAFIANHPNVSKARRKEMYQLLSGTSENGEQLNETIGEMLSEAIEELNTHQGNVAWSVL